MIKEPCIRWGSMEGAILGVVRPFEKQWESAAVFAKTGFRLGADSCGSKEACIRWSLSFVRSFILCGQASSLVWTPALRPFESVQ